MERIITKNKQRASSFELLRILCMLFVIGGHLIGKGMQITYDSTLYGGGEDYSLSRLLYSFCIVAVSTFVLISGYFSIKFNWRKIIKIWFSVLFFSWLIAGYMVIGQNNIKGSLPYFMPIISNEFWFISCYFVLCGVSPLLNRLVDNLSKKNFKYLLLCCLVVFYGWATFNYIFNFRQFVPDFGGGIINFSILYLIGRYIRLYGIKGHSFFFWMCCFVGNTIFMVILELVYSSILHFGFTSFENINSVFVVANAIFLFLAFKNLHFHSRYINYLAVYCLAVYIIHFNDVGMPFLTDFFGLRNLHGINILWSVLFIPPIVYLVCVVIEYMRRIMFDRIENYILDIITQKWKLN